VKFILQESDKSLMRLLPVSRQNIKRTSVAVVHARTGCNRREIGNIVRLKNSALEITDWVSYVEPQHIEEAEPFSPQNAIRLPYDPLEFHGCNFTPKAERFILAGSLGWLEQIFVIILQENLPRLRDLEFHSALDLVGSKVARVLDEGVKAEHLGSAHNQFCRFLQYHNQNEDIQIGVHFDNEIILWISGQPEQPKVSLRWHSTYGAMMAFIRAADES
jgi:hypothetical protein